MSDADRERPVKGVDRVQVVMVVAGLLLTTVLMATSSRVGKRLVQRVRMEDAPAPTFTLPAWDTGTPHAIEQYRGQVVLLDFWATWCPPCIKQMPTLNRLDEDPALEGVVKVISINTDMLEEGETPQDRLAKVGTVMRRGRLKMLNLLDDGSAMQAYHVFSIPTLVIVGPDGQVSALRTGTHSEEELRELIAEAAERE